MSSDPVKDMCEPSISSYLLMAKQFLKSLNAYRYVYVVCGNETCDLDSAVSSIVYGYTLYRKYGPETAVLSVLNIPIEEFALKTELVWHLKNSNINITDLIFRNDIDLKTLLNEKKLKLILVDHHTLSVNDEYLRPSVIEVIDHRPQDPAWTWKNIKLNIETVGSCCTLIAKLLMDLDESYITQEIGVLLYGPIVVDTACFSESVGIATIEDLLVAARLEVLCILDRKKVFRNLQTLKANISHMTPKQVLTKDLKITCGIPICGLPVSAKEFLKRESAQKAVKTFCIDIEASVAVIMGLTINEDNVKRDIAIYSEFYPLYAEELSEMLLTCNNPDFKLQRVMEDAIISKFMLFDMGNIKASRKKILPVIKEFAQGNPPPLFN